MEIESVEEQVEQNLSPEGSEGSSPTPTVELEPEVTEGTKNSDPPLRVKRLGTIMNLLNSLLGAGILSVASSLSSAGVIVSVILIILCAVLSEIATMMLIRLQSETGASGYDELAYNIGGRICSVMLSVFNLIFIYSGLLAYLIIGGDMIISWFKIANIDLSSLWPRAGMILSYSLILPVALTIPKSIGFLSYFSGATVLCIILFFFALIAKAFVEFPRKGIHDTVSLAKIDMSIFSSFSIYVLAFALPCCATTILNPYNTDLKKRNIASGIAMSVTTLLVIVPSVIAYLIFGSTTDGNVLNSFEDNDILITVVRIGFFFVVTFSYPIMGQLVLASWSQLFYGENNPATLPNSKRLICHIPTHAFPVIIAMFMPKAKPILSVGGSLGGIMSNFLYPVILWYLFFKPKVASVQFWGLLVFGIFGVFTAVVATYQSIIDVIAAFSSIKA